MKASKKGSAAGLTGVDPIDKSQYDELVETVSTLGTSRYAVAYKQALSLRRLVAEEGLEAIDDITIKRHVERLNKAGRAGQGYKRALEGKEAETLPHHGRMGQSLAMKGVEPATYNFTLRTQPSRHEAVLEAAKEMQTTATDLYTRGAEELIRKYQGQKERAK